MKKINLHDAINEKKFLEGFEKYDAAKKKRDYLFWNPDVATKYIDKLVEKGVVIIDKNDSKIFSNETETYTHAFILYIWREVVLPFLNTTYEEFEAFDALDKLSKKLK